MSLEIFPVDDFLNSLNTKIKKKQLPESTEGLSNDASLGSELQEFYKEENSKLDLQERYDDLKEKTSWTLFVKRYTISITAIIFTIVFLCLFSNIKLHLSWGKFILFDFTIGSFHLSDGVLITLLSTTLINVLGMCYMGLKYYFGKMKKD